MTQSVSLQRVSSAAAKPWVRFLARRAAGLALGVVFLIVVTFLMVRLIPGDPVRASLGEKAPVQLVEQRREQLGLADSLPSQFVTYVGNLAHGDLGTSIKTDEPVTTIVADRVPNTIELAAAAIAVVLLLGIPLGLLVGVWTSSGRRRAGELGFAFTTGTITAIPEYLMGAFLVVIFGLKLDVLPATGKEGWDSFVLPTVALAIGPACYLARIVRLETVKVLGREYMATARSKHLPPRIHYFRHAVPNVLTGALTIAGLMFSGLLGGTVIIETIFSWPGIGTTIVGAIIGKDYAVVQACVLILGLLVLVVNTLVDVVLVVLNPQLAGLKDV
jgi:peptide/nickel transport system permease protein